MPKIPVGDDDIRNPNRRPGDTALSDADREWAERERERAARAAEESAARIARMQAFNPPQLGSRPVVPVMGEDLGGGNYERREVPDIDDPVRDAPFAGGGRWTEDLRRPASPEGVGGDLGMGSGGPLNEAKGPIPEAVILDFRRKQDEEKAARDAARLRGELGQARTPPDQVAKDLEIANETGANRLDVEVNRPSYELAIEAARIERAKKASPRMTSWLEADRANLELARDDTDNLEWWESAGSMLYNTPGALYAGGVGIGESMFGLGQMAFEAVDEMARSPSPALAALMGDPKEATRIALERQRLQTGAIDPRNPDALLAGTADALGGVRSDLREYKLGVMPQGRNDIESGYYSGMVSLATQAPLIAAAVITKNPSIATVGMTTTTAGEAYSRVTDEYPDMTFAERAGYALRQAGIEFVTELGPNAIIVDALTKGTVKDAISGAIWSRAAEHLGEQSATILQDLDDWLTLNPEGTWEDYANARPSAFVQTFVATLVATEAQMGAGKLAAAAGNRMNESAQQKRSEDIANMMRAMGEGAAASKLLKRLPDKYREVVGVITKDGPLENIRVDGEAFNELAQELGGVDKLAQAFRIDPADALDAVQSGEDVVIPSGNYAAVIQTAKKDIGVSGEQIHTKLAPNIRLRAEDFTAKERAAMQAVFEAEKKAQAEAPEQGFADAADRVRNSIREQVVSTGLYNADAADTQATILSEMVTTLAERTGQDPETLWKEQGFDVVSAITGEQDPDSLAQVGDREAIEVDDATVQRASETLTEYEFAIWKAAALEGRSNQSIADDEDIEALRQKQFMTRSPTDAMPAASSVGILLSKARRLGLPVDKAQKGRPDTIKDEVTRLVKMGLSSKQIHERLGRPPELRNSTNAQVSKIKKAMREEEALAQEKRGTFTPREDRSIIRLFESRNLSTLSHEGAHWYLDTLWKMSKTENPHPFVLQQLASIKEWAGKHPEWDAMFVTEPTVSKIRRDSEGNWLQLEPGMFSDEGVNIQEAFAETFEAYLREGKAPSVGLRAVFASFKQWLVRLYKTVSSIGGRVNINDEIRAVFDRMLATEEAIRAAQSSLTRNSEDMAKALLDRGVITPRQLEKTKERIAAAREQAEAALMARLMDEYERSQKTWWNDEERQTRREVQSEVDERPEQRAYAWLSGVGWRDTRADQAEAALSEAEVMRALEHAPELGFYEPNATDESLRAMQARMVENGIVPVILLFKTTSGRVIAFPGDTGEFGFHHDMAREALGLGDLQLQHGVWNPRKWPTIEAMNASDQAWYDTTGTEQDAREDALAQRTQATDRHHQDVRRVVEFLRANPAFADGALSRIMQETGAPAFAADRGRKEFRRADSLAQEGDLLVYRGSAEDVIGEIENGRLGLGIYSAEEPEIGAEWGGETGKVEAYRIKGRLFDLDETTSQGLENYEKQEDTPAAQALFARLKAEGYVGVRDPWTGHISVFDAKDMQRVASEDRELGTTWTNWANDEMEASPDGDGGRSLAQELAQSRQLDAMGFYSAAQEAATRVPDNIWKMGWQAARNSLAKGQDGIVPRKTEIEFLGLDAMFGDTKLRGEELKSAVLEHIAAKRLSLVENFARMDPQRNRIREALEAYHDYRMELAAKYGVEFGLGPLMNEAERKIWDKLADEALQAEEKFSSEIRMGETREEALARLERESNNLVRGPGDIRLPGEDVPLFESVIGLPEGVPGSDYQAPRSHVGGKAKGTLVTAHGEERVDDKGQRTVFVGQVQSDMAQQAREMKDDVRDDQIRQRLTDKAMEASGIRDRQSALDYLFNNPEAHVSRNDTREEFEAGWSGETSAGVMSTALGIWADRNNAEFTALPEAVIRAMSYADAKAMEKRVVEESGIVDAKSAMDFLFSRSAGYPRQEFEALPEFQVSEEKLIELARVAWARREHLDYPASEPFVDDDTASYLDAPLLSTSEWTNVAVRAMIYRAARDGFQSISFPTAETSEIIQGNDDAAQHYETNVKGALEKIGKQLGGAVRKGGVVASKPRDIYRVFGPDGRLRGTWSSKKHAEEFGDLEPGSSIEVVAKGTQNFADAYILDITPEMRAKIVSEGFPLFHSGGPTRGTTTPPSSLPPMRLNLQAVKDQYGEQALQQIPPEVAAHSAEGTDVEAFVDIARNVRKSLKQKKPKSLWKFLSTQRKVGEVSYSGIRDPDGEILAIIDKKGEARGLIADPAKDGKTSRSYDIEQAATAAWEAGYFTGESPPTPAEFLDALRGDVSGRNRVYSINDQADIADIENANQWSEWFDQNEIDITADDATLSAQLAVVLTGEQTNAIGPDEAAELFNAYFKRQVFPTGRDLLEALKRGPGRAKRIREEALRRMIAEHGDIFNDGSLMREAEAYARNEVQMRQFEIELAALSQAAGKQSESALAKAHAIEALRTKQVREVLNYSQWLTLERRWSAKALAAAQKGDMAKAAEYGRLRLIQSHMYIEGRKLAEEIEKDRKHLIAYGAKTKQARLYAAGKDYADQMNGLLSDYQFRPESKKGEQKRIARGVWIQQQMAGIDPYAAYADPTKTAQEQQVAAAEALERSQVLAKLAEGTEARGFKSLTVEELQTVRAEADMIWKLATLKDRLLKEGERRRLTLAGEDIAAEIEANQPNEKPPEPIETDAGGFKAKSSAQMYFARHRTLQSLAHQFAGGKEGGVFWRYIVRPLNEAFSKLSGLRVQMGNDVSKLFSAYTKAEQERFYRDRQHFAGIGRSLTTQGRLAIALNWGNEKNRRRIMDAYGWNEAQVQEVLDSLSKRDWDFVQATWDYLDTWFAEANRVHEAVHGAPMDKEGALPIATRFGLYKGGYYPIKFDPMLSSKSGQRAVVADAKAQTGQVGTRTKPGSTIKRVEGKVTLPLRLSALDVITQHLDEVAKSIATEETLFDVGRIIKQKSVEDAIVNRHGRQIYNTIVAQLVTAKFGMEGTSGLLAHLRNGATVVGLSWKVATAALQFLGVSNSIVRVGGPWIAMGYARMGKDAASLKATANIIMGKSEFMRHRRQSQSPEMASLLDAMKNKWTPDFITRIIPRELRAAHNFMVRNGFALMSNVQFYSVDMPTWYGAYMKAQSTGATEADAVAMADQAVVDAQGGGDLHQLAAMQSGAGSKYASLLRILTNFMSYMVTTYNLGVQKVRNARTAGQIAALSLDLIMLAALPVAGKMVLDLITRGIGEGDEPEEWAEKYAREQVAFLFGPFVGISQFAGSARGDDAYGYKGPAGLAIFNEMNSMGKAVAEADFDESFWKPANRAAGMVFHYPASQLDASIRGSLAYFNGETDNPAAIFFGPPPAN